MAEGRKQHRNPPSLEGIAEIIGVEAHVAQHLRVDMGELGAGALGASLSQIFEQSKLRPSSPDEASGTPTSARPKSSEWAAALFFRRSLAVHPDAR